MKRFATAITLFCSIAAVSLLQGCATPAQSGAMTVSNVDTRFTTNSDLAGKMAVQSVSGGQSTNPMWASQVDSNGFKVALSNSLRSAGYEAQDNPTYIINAELQALVQPMFGLSFDVVSTVRYTVDGNGKHKRFPVTATGTATVSDAFVGVERLRIANERSIKENIKKFLEQLQGGLD